MIAYDLETCFLKKGLKREATRMLEMGIHGAKVKYQSLINPCEKFSSGNELINDLKKDQAPEATLRFWTKLLVEKGHLNSALKRSPMEKQADAISELLTRSARAILHSKPLDMLYALENVNNPEEFVKTNKCLKPKGALFRRPDDVLKEVFEFDYIWVAHNGNAFDSKIVKGNAKRFNIPCNIEFRDSLPMFRKQLNEASYSLPILYKSVLKKSYRAHHAYDDAKALYELVTHVIGDNLKLLTTKSDLLEIKGIGKKSVEHFNKKNIYCKKDLYEYVATHTLDEWMKHFSDVYRHKHLGQLLFPAEQQEKVPWREV